MSTHENHDIAARLEELASLLEEQGGNPFRARAYHHAAATVSSLDRPVSALLQRGGVKALQELPGIGPGIARAVRDIVQQGRLPMLERLRGTADPVAVLRSLGGIGRELAERLHDELGVSTLEELEIAAHDGRLAALRGFGPKRVAAIRDMLAQRLARVRTPATLPAADEPAVAELLDVDREYRERAARGELRTIAPRRFNPAHEAWLPVLRTQRGARHYTALFSNTARAHESGRTRDWVVLYFDEGGGGPDDRSGGGGRGEHQCTVISAERGPLAGRRIVRGREAECVEFYRVAAARGGGGPRPGEPGPRRAGGTWPVRPSGRPASPGTGPAQRHRPC